MIIQNYCNGESIYESVSGPISDGDYLCDPEGLPIHLTTPPTRILNNHLHENPDAGTKPLDYFHWYEAGIGFAVASLFWGVCFHLWGG
jgi:hypothetical protein